MTLLPRAVFRPSAEPLGCTMPFGNGLLSVVARLEVVVLGFEGLARLAVDTGEQEAAGQVAAGRAIGGVRVAHRGGERACGGKAEAAVHLVVALLRRAFDVIAKAEVY